MRNRRCKILHVITTLEAAGAQTLLLEVARRFDPAKYAILVAYLWGRAEATEVRDHGSSQTTDLWVGEYGANPRIIDLSRRERFDPLSLLRLVHLMRAERVDLVHTHLVHAGVVGKLAARLSDVRAVVTTRHYANDPKSRRLCYRWEDRLTRRVDRVIAVSMAVQRDLCRRGIASGGQVRVVRNGVDFHRFDPGRFSGPKREAAPACVAPGGPADPGAGPGAIDRGATIGTVGRLHPQKGHDTLVRAFAEVRREHRGTRLVIVGDGALRTGLTRVIADLGLGDSVTLLGPVPPTEIPGILAGWDIFAFPSRWEAFGISLLEAMAMELPVVATAVEGIAELVEAGETGLLVPPDDPAALAAALKQMLADPERSRTMGRRARETVRASCDVGCVAQAMEAIYDELLA
jgi:glycosyltransferase involved in cell wall biosynthesis